MGQQQSTKQAIQLASRQIPEQGYRITMLSPQYVNSEISEKLNLMTDYVIDKDPRLLDLKELYESGHKVVEFRVFNVLQYRVRMVKVQIRKMNNIKIVQNQQQTKNNQQQNCQQIFSQLQKSASEIYTILTKNPYTLGIKFKFYTKINDTILRVSKVFKNSPLQKVGIKKDDYIVGVLQGDFGSIKQFVELVKVLIEAQVQHITLAICDLFGETRLQRVTVTELIRWKESYGVGYLGIELAEGWLNKWELKKNIDHKKKRVIAVVENNQIDQVIGNNISNNMEITQQPLRNIQVTSSTQYTLADSHDSPIKQKQQVDFFKQSEQMKHDDDVYQQPQQQKSSQFNKKLQQKSSLTEDKVNLFARDQISKASLQDLPMIVANLSEKSIQKQDSKQISLFVSQPLPVISSTFIEEQIPSSASSVSSQQIQQKCQQLSQLKQRDTNVIKKTQNILQMNFKGILKNQNIDDASTICMCKQYSKHCEKCFKEKDENYYFFNKKTNKIITIEKTMMFPKKN